MIPVPVPDNNGTKRLGPHPREGSVVELNNSEIEAKTGTVLDDGLSKNLEKGWVNEFEPKDDDERARKGLEPGKSLMSIFAQRGMIKLFNQVRAAEIGSEEGSRVVKSERVVRILIREKKGMICPPNLCFSIWTNW